MSKYDKIRMEFTWSAFMIQQTPFYQVYAEWCDQDARYYNLGVIQDRYLQSVDCRKGGSGMDFSGNLSVCRREAKLEHWGSNTRTVNSPKRNECTEKTTYRVTKWWTGRAGLHSPRKSILGKMSYKRPIYPSCAKGQLTFTIFEIVGRQVVSNSILTGPYSYLELRLR